MANHKPPRIEELDENMRIDKRSDSGLRWFTPAEPSFRIAGLAWYSQEKLYRRLPAHPAVSITAAVDSLANHPAGGQIQFRTNSTRISIQVILESPASMDHMTATGECGFDCYVEINGRLHYCSTTRFDYKKVSYVSPLIKDFTAELRDIVLYFPLYQRVKDIRIGLDTGAEILAPSIDIEKKRVIIYGTSITQGGCASRPGMAYPNILSRSFPLEFINLGFSGNGKGEPEMAHLITEIDYPACLILDYEGNSPSLEDMERTLPAFIRIYRSKHPNVPILVLSKICAAPEVFSELKMQARLQMLQIQAKTVSDFRQAGDEHIYFHNGRELFGEDFPEGTVDGTHPTDLGFQRMADRLTPILSDILGYHIEN